MLWNDGWSFALLPLESTYEDFARAEKQPVILPHDWLIADTDNLFLSGDGWYKKTLAYAPDAENKTVFLDFDGVYMDAEVLVNGRVVCAHHYGYTAFQVNLTDELTPGDNEIAVHVRYHSPNSRWYSGAGIFRDVELLALPDYYMLPMGVSVDTAFDGENWRLTAGVEMNREDFMPTAELFDADKRLIHRQIMEYDGPAAALAWTLKGIHPWSVSDPYLYTLVFTLGSQREERKIGFRETRYDPNEGFFLNGEHVKLHGVCLHHDLGLLGAAFHEKAAQRQLQIMRRMGVNAIRTSHNPPARKFLDLCDRMGFLVIDELFDMWEEPKTPYDNARFFPETYRQSVAEWVRRDRCHPSVMMWSIGNEIHDVFTERGRMWTRKLTEEVHRHLGPCAPVTFGSNYMPWQGGQDCAQELESRVYSHREGKFLSNIKIPGYNYAEKHYEEHHRAHPDWVIYGSETGSHLQSRGVYHFPMDAHILSEEDLQCSSLLNSTTSWGTQNLPKMLADDLATPYSMGQFIWSGIDYIGEPTPYHTRNCYFGQADTAGFPKDSYYFYQAMWTDAPMIHIGMIWDWNEGQLIDVPVMTNGAAAELFLNGKSLGRKSVDRLDWQSCLPRWQVPFEKGTLLARAYDEKGNILCEEEKRACGEPKSIRLSCEEKELAAGCGDIAFITVTAADEMGVPVENAVNRMRVKLEGPGVLLGMDNGDSTDTDPYQTDSRCLFAGKLLVMIGAQDQAGDITLLVESNGLEAASLTLRIKNDERNRGSRFQALCRHFEGEDAPLIRRIDLKPLDGAALSPEKPEARFRLRIYPETAAGLPVSLRVTNAQGVDVPCASARQEGDLVTVASRGDGMLYLRASAKNGAEHTRIISCQEITSSGFGAMSLDPYRFIAGALCTDTIGEITPGNEQGVAFGREGFSAAGFAHVDFGPVGSDEITLPIFALDAQLYEITLWDGNPKENGRVIAVLPYQKPSIWNVYQEETYRLPEILTGEHDLYFSLEKKVHMKGFSFARQTRLGRRIRAVDADQLYGDSFVMDQDAVRDIGNNVTLSFLHFDMEKGRAYTLYLEGKTALDSNTVVVRITNEAGEESTSMCAFKGGERSEQAFSVRSPGGVCTVAFIFLPGSKFDFYGFRLMENA